MLLRRLSIKIHITTLFIGLILTLGGVLAWFNYLKVSEILITTSSRLFDHLTDEVSDALESDYFNITSNLKLLSETELPTLATYKDRSSYESAMISILKSHPRTAAISVGYPDGDYFIIRALVGDYMREKFEAPDTATYMVDHIESDQQPRQIQRKFIDYQLRQVEQIQNLDTQYNPTVRPWYQEAIVSEEPVTTSPYLFYFIGKVGITISHHDKTSGAVLAADLTLDDLSEQLANTTLTPSSNILLIDNQHNLVAYQDGEKVLKIDDMGQLKQSSVADLNKPQLDEFLRLNQTATNPKSISTSQPAESAQEHSFHLNGINWFGKLTTIPMGGNEIALLVLSPEHELLTEATNIRNSSTLITAIILLLSLPLTWILASRVARPLIALTKESELIKELDFDQRPPARSFVLEIDELSASMNRMRSTINQFIKLVNTITSEQEHNNILKTVTREVCQACQANAVAIYLTNDSKEKLTQASLFHEPQTTSSSQAQQKAYLIKDQTSAIQEAIHQHTLTNCQHSTQATNTPNLIDDLALAAELTWSEVVAIPLLDRKQDLIGLLVMVFERDPSDQGISQKKISFAEALAGFCAESLEKNRLYLDQKHLLESFIKLMAGAIDAKSPYTGGHCQRVPELAKLLAKAACEDDQTFKSFKMNEEEWEALHIASWLHDCGKVTTPEYVVDKATRLETIYNRIHEIRTRVEVLKRDAMIAHHKQRAHYAMEGTLTKEREAQFSLDLTNQLTALDEDFAFIAQCNSGETFIDPETLQRLKEIGSKRWQRTLSDRIGLSWEERQRKELQPEADLPAEEQLLDDRYDHLIARDSKPPFEENNAWGFKMSAPEYKFNLGELYNLSAKTGTLTEEERFIINDHIVQTIIMLDKLPFPKHLQDVPDIAGNHHERMDGNGYPRRRTGDDMSVPSRIMAIADIFEALTACDRPYKEAKPLSKALTIMKRMAEEEHIDLELFKLFIRAGVYKEYARKFLSESQIDHVDEDALLTP